MSGTEDGVEDMRIFIVTPCFNSGPLLQRTIDSVLAYDGAYPLHYHIQDGGSSDETLKILRSQFGNEGIFKHKRNVKVTFDSRPDDGPYLAVVNGFAEQTIADNDIMTWINAGDYFVPGAIEQVATVCSVMDEVRWIAGITRLDEGQSAIEVYGPIPTEFVREGLCDSQHFPFLQQEGMFWRGDLWRQRCSALGAGLAGDYHLWREFARHTELHHVRRPIASFVRHSGQLSASKRAEYLNDLYGSETERERNERFISSVKRCIGQSYKEVVKCPQHGFRAVEGNMPFKQQRRYEAPLSPDHPERSGQIIFYDRDWQHPAITELSAFRSMRNLSGSFLSDANVVYLAFPWATLIDCWNLREFRKVSRLLNMLQRCQSLIKPGEYVITVCQHIQFEEFNRLFRDHGVNEVFASHAEVCHQHTQLGKPRVMPFPLCSVQRTSLYVPFRDRRFLFSFVGARSTSFYRTQCRDWLYEELSADKRGFMAINAQWFYQDTVYEQQISGREVSHTDSGDAESDMAYRDLMGESKFVLCPSGSGPNTIRLWEAIDHGAIPVVLADGWWPPGDKALWQQACVWLPESRKSVRRLPKILRRIAADPSLVSEKQSALAQLRTLYARDSLVVDVVERMADIGCRQKEQVILENWRVNSSALLGLGRIATAVLQNERPTELPPDLKKTVSLLKESLVAPEPQQVSNGGSLPSKLALNSPQFWEITRVLGLV